MQFIHLFSFVVVASYAAALPQPAGLSEKYSKNADATLASGLETRSYQPVLNSYKESATLVSLKRRDNSEGSTGDNSEGSVGDNSEGSAGDNSEGSTGDNSEGSTGDNSGSDSSPPPATTLENTVSVPFTDKDVTSMNLAFTINNVRYGGYTLLDDVERAGKNTHAYIRDMVTMYLGKIKYVNAALERWAETSLNNTLDVIKSYWGEDKYSKIIPDLTKRIKELNNRFRAGSNDLASTTSNLANGFHPVIANLIMTLRPVQSVLLSRTTLFWKLRNLLRKFKASKTLRGRLDDIIESIGKFRAEQQKLFDEIMKRFEVLLSQQ
ncbi:hypothetical protein BASA50_002029 [Batrachochytrium salamandrivorans]|uniref:Uncharacterized protein n=1 Tax=Batrachochytrium salamandrivorans TaxID=1357716 RepID=A0ABQ8FQ95_9FUNG|nr:hypothetical protein BASA50_002029 [Batrachochytrium salamandrivorans]